MQLETFVILLSFLLLVGIVAIIILLISFRQPKDDTSIQLIVNLLHNLQSEINQTGTQSRQEVQERLSQIIGQLTHHQQSTSQHLVRHYQSNTNLIKEISSQLTQIDATNKQVLGFTERISGLEKILQNPKRRGILGEYFLETLLGNVLQPKQYKMQYTFKNRTIVDAAIFFNKTIIPIDAKFSLEKYNQMVQTDNPKHRAILEKAFKGDLKARIDETAKYILPDEGTTDFAFMFIPAEGIYYNLLIYKAYVKGSSATDLIEYAFKKRVIIVSPTSFYAYLQTVVQGLKALKIEESVKEVIKKVGVLGRHLEDYEEHLDKLGKHLSTTVNMYNQANKNFQAMDKDVFNITDGAQGGDFQPNLVDKPDLERKA